MKDLETPEDIYKIVATFYDNLLGDSAISYLFTDVVVIQLEEHLPILVTFWSQALLGTGGYYKNLTQIHLDVHHKSALTPELFTRWINHFYAAIDAHFQGFNCERMKTQALNLATVMQIKIAQENKK
ncbi:MAG: group III truncated hemoglobin [Flavobacterium sp.]|nr:group III truncated hemoglobin [Flavobacterium sp.]